MRIAIIGGGAAGYFAAANLPFREDWQVIFLEGTVRPLTKVKISGGGRCNVTHNLFDLKAFAASYPRGNKEILGALHRFGPQDTIDWFAKRGVTLKAEADGRMFPTTDKSETVITCLQEAIAAQKVELQTKVIVQKIDKQSDGTFVISCRNQDPIQVDKVILCTGSAPMGHELATHLGHTIIPGVPSLFTFGITHPLLQDLAGVSFPKVEIKLFKKVRQAPIVITHWGLSGPCVLWLSAFCARELHEAQYNAKLHIHWLPHLSKEDVALELKTCKKEHAQKDIAYSPQFGLAKRFWQRLVEFCGIPTNRKWADLSRTDEQKMLEALCHCEMTVQSKGEFKEEFVTCGGVDRREIDFRTYESKITKGLYFAGEIIDIDGVTGGFNFQNAWTSAFLAAKHIATGMTG